MSDVTATGSPSATDTARRLVAGPIRGLLGRAGERAIVMHCVGVTLILVLLFVLERLGASRTVLGTLALAAPMASVMILAWTGRTMDPNRFRSAGRSRDRTSGRPRDTAAGAGSLISGLSGFVVPAALLWTPAALLAAALRPAGLPWLVATTLGVVIAAIAVAPAQRRAASGGIGDLLATRLPQTGLTPRIARFTHAAASLGVALALAAVACALLNALVVALGLAVPGRTVAVLLLAALVVTLVGGMQAVTLICAYLGFFLVLALLAPAVAALAGFGAVADAMVELVAVAATLFEASPSFWSVPLLALGIAVLPVWTLHQAATRAQRATRPQVWTTLAGFVTVAAVYAVPPGALATVNLGVERSDILTALPVLGWIGVAWATLVVCLFAAAQGLVALPGQDRRRSGPTLGAMAVLRLASIVCAGALAIYGQAEEWTVPDDALRAVVCFAAAVLGPAVVGTATWWRAHPIALAAAPWIGALPFAAVYVGTLDAAVAALLGAALGTGAVVAIGLMLRPTAQGKAFARPAPLDDR